MFPRTFERSDTIYERSTSRIDTVNDNESIAKEKRLLQYSIQKKSLLEPTFVYRPFCSSFSFFLLILLNSTKRFLRALFYCWLVHPGAVSNPEARTKLQFRGRYHTHTIRNTCKRAPCMSRRERAGHVIRVSLRTARFERTAHRRLLVKMSFDFVVNGCWFEFSLWSGRCYSRYHCVMYSLKRCNNLYGDFKAQRGVNEAEYRWSDLYDSRWRHRT